MSNLERDLLHQTYDKCTSRQTEYSTYNQNMRIYQNQTLFDGEGNGTPLQYSCLENPMPPSHLHHYHLIPCLLKLHPLGGSSSPTSPDTSPATLTPSSKAPPLKVSQSCWFFYTNLLLL